MRARMVVGGRVCTAGSKGTRTGRSGAGSCPVTGSLRRRQPRLSIRGAGTGVPQVTGYGDRASPSTSHAAANKQPRFATPLTWGALIAHGAVKAPHVSGHVGRLDHPYGGHGAPGVFRCKARLVRCHELRS